MNIPMRIHIQLLNDAALVQVIRRAVTATLEEMGVSETGVYDAALLIGEACGNVVRHAYGKPSLYEIWLEIGDNSFDLKVLDYGKGFDPSLGSKFGHFGLSIMSTIDPDIRIESTPGERTMVSAHMPIEYDAASSTAICTEALCLCGKALTSSAKRL